jgi:hypothetical protein
MATSAARGRQTENDIIDRFFVIDFSISDPLNVFAYLDPFPSF